jgi:hypothetical protein
MRLIAAASVIGFILGGFVVYRFSPKQTQIQERVVYKDRVQTVVTEVIVEKKDGTKEIRREVVKTEDRDKTQVKTETKPQPKPDWAIGVQYDLLSPDSPWTAQVNRRVLGNLYIGVSGGNNSLGVGVLYLF